MVNRCETIGKYVMPVFRSLVAKELVNILHLTQVDAAKKIGTTQAAISQYLKLEPNDALAVDVMQQNNIAEVYSFDEHFDQVEGINRFPKIIL